MDAISYANFKLTNIFYGIYYGIMKLLKKYKIGILGAGQLGLFLAEKCQQKNLNWCIFYDSITDPGHCAFKKNSILLSKNKSELAKQLELCEFIILENEFHEFAELEKINCHFIPSLDSYKNFYGKINQRLFYQSLGLFSPKFWIITDISQLDQIDIFPIILKKNLHSYDGNGNRECKNLQELHKNATLLGLPLLAEKKLSIKAEFAVGIVANQHEQQLLPMVETIQKNHICHYVIGPYQLDESLQKKLDIELKKLLSFPFFGLFAFEFFITNDDQIIINEGAARPHNSQHLTMNLCDKSQFDYIIELAINPSMVSPYKIKSKMGAMINLLGKKDILNPKLEIINIPEEFPHSIYLYGKKEGRIGRKLGHLNILNNEHTRIEFIDILDKIYQGYSL